MNLYAKLLRSHVNLAAKKNVSFRVDKSKFYTRPQKNWQAITKTSPMSLLPICEKFLERLLCNSKLEVFMKTL